jgi:hypothetical protein
MTIHQIESRFAALAIENVSHLTVAGFCCTLCRLAA